MRTMKLIRMRATLMSQLKTSLILTKTLLIQMAAMMIETQLPITIMTGSIPFCSNQFLAQRVTKMSLMLLTL